MPIPVIGDIIKSVGDVITHILPDGDERKKLQAEVTTAILNHSKDLAAAQRDIIVAEAQGESWLQRNWRPILMLTVVAILANNYILVPYATLWTDRIVVLDLPPELFGLLTVGVGGYVVGRTYEKAKGVE